MNSIPEDILRDLRSYEPNDKAKALVRSTPILFLVDIPYSAHIDP